MHTLRITLLNGNGMSTLRTKSILSFICITLMLQMVVTVSCIGQSQELFEAYRDGKAGLIDIKGHWVLKPSFDSIDDVENHYVYFYKDSLMGIANLRGKVLVQPRWKELMSDEYGLAMARDERGTTYIKVHNGKPICSYYKDVSFFHEGMLSVQDSNDKWGTIDRYGVRAIPCRYDSLEYFQQGVVRAWVAGKSLFIDKDGREVDAPAIYETWRPGHSGRFLKGGKWGAVNKRGDTVFQPVYDYLDYWAGVQTCVFCKDGKCGAADSTGTIIVAPKFDYLRELNSWAPNAACLEGKWGTVNEKCEPVIPFQFESLEPLYGGRAAAKADGKWGIVDREGAWLLSPQFERIRQEFTDDDEKDEEDEEQRSDERTVRFSCGLRRREASTATAADPASRVAVNVFPNPTAGRFTIELPEAEPASYKLYDNRGAVVQSGLLNGKSNEGDITALPAGAYTLVVTYEERMMNVRLTKR
jgi:hypothetical protein